MIFGTDEHPDAALVSLWMAERFTAIIQGLEDALRSCGFGVRTTVDDPYGIQSYVMNDGRQVVVDVTKTLFDIATIQPSNDYDRRLSNPLYEASKIARMVNERVAAVVALFGGEDVLDKLSEISKDLNVKFVIVDRIDDANN